MFSFPSSKHHSFSMYLHLDVKSHLRRRYAYTKYYILGDDGHVRSQGGRQPDTAKPPLHILYYVVWFRLGADGSRAESRELCHVVHKLYGAIDMGTYGNLGFLGPFLTNKTKIAIRIIVQL